MKKEYLDYLYELRSSIQNEIKNLEYKYKQPSDDQCSWNDVLLAELRTRKSQLGSLDSCIEKYLEIYK